MRVGTLVHRAAQMIIQKGDATIVGSYPFDLVAYKTDIIFVTTQYVV